MNYKRVGKCHGIYLSKERPGTKLSTMFYEGTQCSVPVLDMNNCNTSSINFNALVSFLNLLHSSSSTLKACSHFVNWGRLQDQL